MDTDKHNELSILAGASFINLFVSLVLIFISIKHDGRLLALEKRASNLSADIITVQSEVKTLRADLDKAPSLQKAINDQQNQIVQLQTKLEYIDKGTEGIARFLTLTFPREVQFWLCINGHIRYGCS